MDPAKSSAVLPAAAGAVLVPMAAPPRPARAAATPPAFTFTASAPPARTAAPPAAGSVVVTVTAPPRRPAAGAAARTVVVNVGGPPRPAPAPQAGSVAVTVTAPAAPSPPAAAAAVLHSTVKTVTTQQRRARLERAKAALPRRAAVAKALFVLGCAAAALALFAMSLNTTDSLLLGSCKPTDTEVADLRAASGTLLMVASTQAAAAAVAVFAPARPFSFIASTLGTTTAVQVAVFLPTLLSCHGHVLGGAFFVVCDVIFFVLMCAALGATFIIAWLGDH